MSQTDAKFLFSYLLGADGSGQAIDADAVVNWTPEQGKLWAHIDANEPGTRKWLREQSGLPQLAIDALLADETRPRASILQNGLVIVLRGVNTNPGEDPEDMVSVRVWVDSDRVISTRRRRLLSVVDIAGTLDAGSGPENPGALLARLVERLADRIGDFVDSIENRLDTAEDDIGKTDAAKFRPMLASLRRQIAAVRRFLAPQRDALDSLNRHELSFISERDAHTLRQEADRIMRHLEDLDLARERAVVLQEELLSHIAEEQNARMYVLSIVAAIFLPLSFVTGLLGMNVGGLPGVDNQAGFMVSVGVMAGAAIALLVYFRWKKWL